MAMQVFHMKEAGIECGYLGGSMSYDESRVVMDALKQQPPSIRVVFVTTEKIARSDALMRLLDTLHQQNHLVGPKPYRNREDFRTRPSWHPLTFSPEEEHRNSIETPPLV